jgi:hypothetical protein
MTENGLSEIFGCRMGSTLCVTAFMVDNYDHIPRSSSISLSKSSSMSSPTPILGLTSPALVPPYGVQAHFTTTSPEQNWYYVCAVLCTTVSGIFVLLRLYTKVYVIRKIDLTDCMNLNIDNDRSNIQTVVVVTAFVNHGSHAILKAYRF